MSDTLTLNPVAHIRSDFPTKFGIPRQSGLAASLRSAVVFVPDCRDPAALRGLEGFSHLWLLWVFSRSGGAGWSPTVRPPRLGGNERMGVFATRSPFRPNPIGLSAVKLEEIRLRTPEGPQLIVSGADLMDGTPILDIKPYLPYADCHPEALGGFAPAVGPLLEVVCPPELLAQLPEDKAPGLLEVLSRDPRPSYQHDPDRVYGMGFAGHNVRFSVSGNTLTVLAIESLLP